jgi:hypothetical protein
MARLFGASSELGVSVTSECTLTSGLTLDDVLETLLEQAAHVIVVETVVDEPSLPPTPNNVELPERSELMGNGGLAHVKRLGQIGRTELAERERVHDADAGRVSQNTEGLRKCASLSEREQIPVQTLPATVRLTITARSGRKPWLEVCRHD